MAAATGTKPAVVTNWARHNSGRNGRTFQCCDGGRHPLTCGAVSRDHELGWWP